MHMGGPIRMRDPNSRRQKISLRHMWAANLQWETYKLAPGPETMWSKTPTVATCDVQTPEPC